MVIENESNSSSDVLNEEILILNKASTKFTKVKKEDMKPKILTSTLLKNQLPPLKVDHSPHRTESKPSVVVKKRIVESMTLDKG